MSALPTIIEQFIKRVANKILLEKYKEEIIVEKHLHMIRVIKDDEPRKYSRDPSRKPQAMVSKGKDKGENHSQILTRLIKNLTTEVPKLKQ